MTNTLFDKVPKNLTRLQYFSFYAMTELFCRLLIVCIYYLFHKTYLKNKNMHFSSHPLMTTFIGRVDRQSRSLGQATKARQVTKTVHFSNMDWSILFLGLTTIKLGFNQRLNKEQIGNSEPFPVINLPIYYNKQ